MFASRERVTELEKILSSSQRSFEAQESTLKYLRDDVGRLQQRLEDTTTANDDLYLHNLQLREKTQAREKQLGESAEQLADWEANYKKLDLQFQRAQQTLEQHRRAEEEEEKERGESKSKGKDDDSTTETSSTPSAVENANNALSRENEHLRGNVQNLQAQLQHYNASFQNLVGERDALAQQYQNHFAQMKTHAQELEGRLKEEEEGKRSLEEELREQLADLNELRAELEGWKEKGASAMDEDLRQPAAAAENEKEQLKSPSPLDATVNGESQSLAESLSIIRQLQVDVDFLREENTRLAVALEEEGVKADQLRDHLRADETDAADRQRLLANLENDKQALSRALAQNKELKAQLTEMHEGFVRLNEEKCRLTTQWEAERHAAKEANHVLSVREDALKRLSAESEEKERRLTEAEADIVKKEVVVNELERKVNDMEVKLAAGTIERNRDEETTLHFGVNQRLVEALQEELAGAQDAINALSGQNAELREKITAIEGEARVASARDAVAYREDAAAVEMIAAQAKKDEEKINELLQQRDALANRYEDTEEKCKALRIQLETMRVHMEANASFVAAPETRREEEEEEEMKEDATEEVQMEGEEVQMEGKEDSQQQPEGTLEAKDVAIGATADAYEEVGHITVDGNASSAMPPANADNSDTDVIEDDVESPRPTTSYSDVETQTRRSSFSSSSPDDSPETSSMEGEEDRDRWESTSVEKSGVGVSREPADLDDEEGEDEVPRKNSRASDVSSEAPLPTTSKGVDAGVQSEEVMSLSSSSSANSEAEVSMWREKYDTLSSAMDKLTQVKSF